MQLKCEKLVMTFFSSAAALSRSFDSRLTGERTFELEVVCSDVWCIHDRMSFIMSAWVYSTVSLLEKFEANRVIDNTRDERNSPKYRNRQLAIYRCTLQRSYQQNFLKWRNALWESSPRSLYFWESILDARVIGNREEAGGGRRREGFLKFSVYIKNCLQQS